MKHLFLTCAISLVIGCAAKSKIVDVEAYPPGTYGLYELSTKQLVGKYTIGPDETFGFEYHDKALVATTVERLKGPRGEEAYQVEHRIPLNSKRYYEWRRLDKPAPATKAS